MVTFIQRCTALQTVSPHNWNVTFLAFVHQSKPRAEAAGQMSHSRPNALVPDEIYRQAARTTPRRLCARASAEEEDGPHHVHAAGGRERRRQDHGARGRKEKRDLAPRPISAPLKAGAERSKQ